MTLPAPSAWAGPDVGTRSEETAVVDLPGEFDQTAVREPGDRVASRADLLEEVGRQAHMVAIRRLKAGKKCSRPQLS